MALTTPPQSAFLLALDAMKGMTEAELQAAVALLPPDLRERLAAGPHPVRYTCAVCEAFGRRYYSDVKPDLSDPMFIAWAYHEVPKADMKRRAQQWHGPLANEIYKRCIVTYRAAGWLGEAQEADA